MSYLVTSGRHIPHQHLHIAIMAICMSLAWGCASPGPQIDRYASRPGSPNPSVVDWGNDAWTAALLGDDDLALEILRDPPDNIHSKASQLADRFVITRTQLMNQRVQEARKLLAQTSDIDFQNAVEQLSTIDDLGDMYLAGLDEPILNAQVADALQDIQKSLIISANESEGLHEWRDAAVRWMMVENLAADLEQHEEIRQARREHQFASMITEWTDSTSLQSTRSANPSVYIRILEILAERHVTRPDWRPLIDVALNMMLLRADPRQWSGNTHESRNLDVFLQELDTIVDECRNELASHPDMNGVIPDQTKAALRKMLRRIRLATEDRDTPSFQVLARAFIMGAALETDSRSGMIWAEGMEELNRSLGQDYVGIGAMIEDTPGRSARLEPIDGSPARQAGIQSDDQLIAVDGRMIEHLTSSQVVRSLLGPRDTSVTLTIEREGSPEPIDITVVRHKVLRPNVTGWRQVGIGPGGKPSWDWIIQADLGIAYLRIDQFTLDTEREFRTALRQASDTLGPNRQVEGLVIDLRDNPGGNKDAASALLDLFINTGTTYREEKGPTRNWDFAHHEATRLAGMPTAVLMNEKSASASELVAGTLQARCNAVVIGERSYGKGSVQSLHSVGGGIMKVTTAWYTIPVVNKTRNDLEYQRELRDMGVKDMSMMNLSKKWRVVDRSQQPTNWGIEPQIAIGVTDKEHLAATEYLGAWYSHLGQDQPPSDPSAQPSSLTESKDLSLLFAVALLDARIMAYPPPKSLDPAS